MMPMNCGSRSESDGQLMLCGRCTLSLAFRYMRRQGLEDPRRGLVPARALIAAKEPGYGSLGRSTRLGGCVGGAGMVCAPRER